MKNTTLTAVEVAERHLNSNKTFHCIDRFGDYHSGFILHNIDEYSGEFNGQYRCNGYVITHVLEPITPSTEAIEPGV